MAIRTSNTTEKAKKISFEVTEECGVISNRTRGNREETIRLDYASWNGNEPKYEIRIWAERDGEIQPGKGIGLTGEELIALRDLINKIEKED